MLTLNQCLDIMADTKRCLIEIQSCDSEDMDSVVMMVETM